MAIGDEFKEGLVSLVKQGMLDKAPKNLGGIYGTDLTEAERAANIQDISKAEGTPLYGIPEFDRLQYAARDYRSMPSLYEMYLSGSFPEETAAAATDTAQIPGAIDTLVTTPAEEEMTFQDVVDSDANVGFIDAPVDTTMPPMLTPDMGMDTVVDTTPDYSRLDHSGHPMAKQPAGTIPPDTIGPQPVNIIERETSSKRYTYLLGENESCTTAAERFHFLYNSRNNLNKVF